MKDRRLPNPDRDRDQPGESAATPDAAVADGETAQSSELDTAMHVAIMVATL